MKLKPMERVDRLGGTPNPDRRRDAITLGIVLGIHIAIFWLLNYIPQKNLSLPVPPIEVKLIVTERVPETPKTIAPETALPPIEPEPEPEPEAILEPKPEPAPPSSAPILNPAPAPPQPNPSAILLPETDETIPDRWRLPPGSRISLDKLQPSENSEYQQLSIALDCIGFEVDCSEQRKDIFAEEQLSNTDLVWMPSFAHSGLSDSDLYGLSEAEIRDRLGIPTAGKNGLMLFPGIGIDGPLWDKLHGVNSSCSYSVGTNANGSKELRKHCKPLKPSSKDRIGFIPKPVE